MTLAACSMWWQAFYLQYTTWSLCKFLGEYSHDFPCWKFLFTNHSSAIWIMFIAGLTAYYVVALKNVWDRITSQPPGKIHKRVFFNVLYLSCWLWILFSVLFQAVVAKFEKTNRAGRAAHCACLNSAFIFHNSVKAEMEILNMLMFQSALQKLISKDDRKYYLDWKGGNRCTVGIARQIPDQVIRQ